MGTRPSGGAGRAVVVIALSSFLAVSACGSSPKPGVIDRVVALCLGPGPGPPALTVIVTDRAGREAARQTVARPSYRFRFTVKRGDYIVSVFFFATGTARAVHVKAGHAVHVRLANYEPGSCI